MGDSALRLYDFDPLRVRKEISDRRNAIPKRAIIGSSQPPGQSLYEDEGEDVDGINLVRSETVLPNRHPLLEEMRTGRELPYMYVERPSEIEVVLIDGERVIAIGVSGVNVLSEAMS